MNPAEGLFGTQEDEAAPHESAHAVVAVRSGIPVRFVEIRRQLVRDRKKMPSLRHMKPGTAGVALGHTSTGSALRDFWRARDTPEGQDGLRRYAVVTLAGVYSDMRLRGSTFEAVEHNDDVQLFYDICDYLGITGWPAVKAFGDECLDRVRDLLLLVDKGRAWQEVAKRLLERRRLQGDEVRRIAEVTAGLEQTAPARSA